MKKESCPECRREMKIDKILNETEAIMECQHCKKTFKFTYDEKHFLLILIHLIGELFYRWIMGVLEWKYGICSYGLFFRINLTEFFSINYMYPYNLCVRAILWF